MGKMDLQITLRFQGKKCVVNTSFLFFFFGISGSTSTMILSESTNFRLIIDSNRVVILENWCIMNGIQGAC